VNMIKTTDILWTSDDAERATGGEVHPAWQASGVSINTRTLQPGDLFIALQGPNADGHDYVANAFEKGAAAAAVCHRPPVLDPDAPLLVVDDTMKALEELGVFGRQRATNAKFIAVTGSVGKTGTKEALKLVLSRQGKTSASEGSLNNHWGLPLSLARVPADADFAVLEMGMNHPGELIPLSQMARPHVCVVTTIAPAHTEFFDSTEQIAQAKAEIFQGAMPGATAVLNRDIPEFSTLNQAADRAGLRVVTFGEQDAADFRLISCDVQADGSDVTAATPLGEIRYRVGAAGKHWVMNSLCVLAAVHAAGGDVHQAAKALTDLTSPSGRGERFEIKVDGGSVLLIDESYNASPASIKASMAVLGTQNVGPNGRRIAILGDMLELGPASAQRHADIADVLNENDIDLAYLAGNEMNHLWAALAENRKGAHCENSDALANEVRLAVRPGDVVMVKGSAGSRMNKVVAVLKSIDLQKGDT